MRESLQTAERFPSLPPVSLQLLSCTVSATPSCTHSEISGLELVIKARLKTMTQHKELRVDPNAARSSDVACASP